MASKKIAIKSQIIYILIFISILIYINNQDPHIFTLSNEKIVMVKNDGIYFFTSKMIEENEKRIIFQNIIENPDKINLVQFSSRDDEYIIISVIYIIYFFDKDGNIITYSYLSDSMKDYNYTIIPYKKENNFLHYIITYPEKNNESFLICHFKLDIDYSKANQILSLKNIKIKEENNSIYSVKKLSKINCVFMLDSKINRDILVCFYFMSVNKIEIQVKSFDPKDDFNEMKKNFKNYKIKDINFEFNDFFSVMTNKNRNKALIYLINGYPYMVTFDLEKYFTELVKIIDIDIFNNGYSQYKIFKLIQNNDLCIISSINNNFCKLYTLYFNSNFEIEYKAVIEQDTKCINLNLFSSFPNGTIYTIFPILNNTNNNFYKIKNLYKSIRKLDSTSPKCSEETEESKIFNLCISCNTPEYIPVEIPTNITYDSQFKECYKKDENPQNFYLDETDPDNPIYRPCYETCASCSEGGNENNNNCIKCAIHYRPNPKSSSDCVASCTYFYYYTFYEQYKCSEGSNCPEEAPLYIFEEKKCTDDCSKESNYPYQYAGSCYKDCPPNTILSENNLCKDDVNDNRCKLSLTPLELQGNSLIDAIDVSAKSFADEFGYIPIHVSYFFNNEFSFVLYQEYECLEELNINITKIEFEECYTKVKDELELNDNEKIIISIVERKNEKGQSISIFYFYSPRTGQRIDIATICKDDTVTVKKSLTDELNNTNLDLNSMLYLTDQNIDIFNLSGEFYTDICFHFESPNGKDVPLKDRILSFYPNISLCEDECQSKGVNLTTMESICECTLSGILNNDLISGNALLENTFGEVAEFISNSNLDVMKCYKDVFKGEYMKKNIGGIIVIIILGLQIIFGILFFVVSMGQIKNYLTNLSEFFASLIIIRKKEKKDENNLTKEKNDKKGKNKLNISGMNNPPLKSNNKEKTTKKKNQIRETEQKKIKKSSINKLDLINEDYNTNLNSQKSFDGLYKDKFVRQKLNSKILKNNEEMKNEDIEIFKLRQDNKKKDLEIEIKKIQEKYGIDEEEYLKTDFDDMEFDDAIKYDNRTFWEYFWDKFKENQIIMNTFVNKENLKPLTIKVILLLLNIDLYFVVNGLFFSESYISELFHSEEEEKFFSYFPRSISRFFYTTIVGVIASTIMDCILIEEKKVKRVFMREKENHDHIKHEISLIIKSVQKNYIIFMVICFVISLISWYYACCFNNVYPGVKVEWIKSSITIMIIMQILSFLAGLLVAIIRLISFKCKSEKLYKLKDFFN